MFTILGGDGKEYGPVTAVQIKEWIHGNRATMQTQCRRVGETTWKTVADYPEFGFAGAKAFVPPPDVPSASAVQGAANVAEFSATITDAAPAQPMPDPADAKAYAEALLARGGSVDVFECLSRSFHLWADNFLPLVGVTLLVLILQGVLGVIPLLGTVSGMLFNGVFYGGLYYYYFGKMRHEPRELGDAFAGFTRALAPLMLTTLLKSLLTVAIAMVFFFPWFGFFVYVLQHPGQMGELPVLTPTLISLSLAGGLILVFASVAWSFAVPLVIDKGLGPWAALAVSWRVVTRNWFAVFFAIFLGGILTLLGVIGLFVGVFFTIPLVIGAQLYAYEMLCNPPTAAKSAAKTD